MATKKYTQWWATLLLALMTLALSLSACQVPLDSSASANTAAVVVATDVAGSSSATPSVPPFTIGVWTSNSSPQARGTITVYILCMTQDQTTGGPSGPASGIHVRIKVLAPINRTYSGTTAADGTAAVKVKYDDKHSGSPVAVDVTATWHGATYQGQTYFTPAPQGTVSPTPSRTSTTPIPNASPSITPSTPTAIAAPPTPTSAPIDTPAPESPPTPTPTDPIAP